MMRIIKEHDDNLSSWYYADSNRTPSAYLSSTFAGFAVAVAARRAMGNAGR
jgi:hypothetical protein